jgi:hypothetical protein
MKIAFTICSHRNGKEHAGTREGPDFTAAPGRPARIACLIALAYRFDALMKSGAVKDYAELARLGYVSRARITQIMNLLDLAPAIQVSILGVHPGNGPVKAITERRLRPILREVLWDRQMALFQELEAEVSSP